MRVTPEIAGKMEDIELAEHFASRLERSGCRTPGTTEGTFMFLMDPEMVLVEPVHDENVRGETEVCLQEFYSRVIEAALERFGAEVFPVELRPETTGGPDA